MNKDPSEDGTETIVGDVTVSLGTPKEPLGEAAIFLQLWRSMRAEPDKPRRSCPMAFVCVVQPDRAGYVVKPVTRAVHIAHPVALASALSTARSRKVGRVYLNADLDRLPAPVAAAD